MKFRNAFLVPTMHNNSRKYLHRKFRNSTHVYNEESLTNLIELYSENSFTILDFNHVKEIIMYPIRIQIV